MVGDKCSFPFITFLDVDVVVLLLEVDFGKEFCSLDLGDEFQY